MLPVQLAKDCSDLAQPVAEPVWTNGKRSKVLLAETTSALLQANDNLRSTARCQDKLYDALGTPYEGIAATRASK